jgi:hypothetical protein
VRAELARAWFGWGERARPREREVGGCEAGWRMAWARHFRESERRGGDAAWFHGSTGCTAHSEVLVGEAGWRIAWARRELANSGPDCVHKLFTRRLLKFLFLVPSVNIF